jgi:hypothetical protein
MLPGTGDRSRHCPTSTVSTPLATRPCGTLCTTTASRTASLHTGLGEPSIPQRIGTACEECYSVTKETPVLFCGFSFVLFLAHVRIDKPSNVQLEHLTYLVNHHALGITPTPLRASSATSAFRPGHIVSLFLRRTHLYLHRLLHLEQVPPPSIKLLCRDRQGRIYACFSSHERSASRRQESNVVVSHRMCELEH